MTTPELQQEAERLIRMGQINALIEVLTERERLRKENEKLNPDGLFHIEMVGLKMERNLLLSQHRLLVEVARAYNLTTSCEARLEANLHPMDARNKLHDAFFELISAYPTILKDDK
jgi:hypothetical protein